MRMIIISWAMIWMKMQCSHAMTPGAWCKHLQITQEPKLLIYNRIPKCGSSTIQQLLKDAHDDAVVSFATHEQLWGKDYDQDTPARGELYAAMQAHLTSTSVNITTIMDGHWPWHTFSPVHDRRVEYFQMVRSCEDRARSFILYSLFSSKAATEAKLQNKTDDYLGKLLNCTITNGEIDQCFRSEECMRNSLFMQTGSKYHLHDGLMAKYFCGQNCIEQHNRSLYDGAYQTMVNPLHGFTVVGLMEHMHKSLSMLECAFPTAFKHAAARYARDKIKYHIRRSMRHPATAPVNNLARQACFPIDSKLIAQTETIFWRRYNYMTRHRTNCCRASV